jgi:hypothetical protein
MKIYVASSWRNRYQPGVVALLRELGCEVYDFRNPTDGDHGFSWSQLPGQGAYEHGDAVSGETLREMLAHPISQRGYALDIGAVRWCDVGVLVLPSGRSASWEFGNIMGQGKPGILYMPEPCEPELMYSEASIATDAFELSAEVGRLLGKAGSNG